jgi:hypothetical protein
MSRFIARGQGRHVGFLVAAAAAFVLLIGPPRAEAGPLVASATDCAGGSLSRPFLPWLDPANYFIAPGGAFEDGAAGWQLGGGATVVSGNETFRVHDPGDSHSLSLPAGSSTTSTTTCVGLEYPTLRFFARNRGSLLSTLRVEVLFEGANGNVNALTIGRLLAGRNWQPTIPLPIVVNLLPLLPGEQTPVAFRFTPRGGDWQIDDVYVDPHRKG